MAHRTQKNSLLLLPTHNKGYFRDYLEHPGEEVRFRGSWVTRISVLVELRYAILPPYGCVHQCGIALSIIFTEFYAGFIAYVWSIFNSVSSFSSILRQWARGRAKCSVLLIMIWCFWLPVSIQESTASHFVKSKDAPIIQKIPRDW